MVKLFDGSFRTIRAAVVACIVGLVAGCMSQEDQARNYYERGVKLRAEHDNARAAIEFRNAVKIKKNYIEGWRALAEIDEANNDWLRVVGDLRSIVEFAPDDVSARLKLGKLLTLAGSAKEAATLAGAGLERDDRNPDLHALKAAADLKLDDRVSATREAQAALALDPANAEALMVLAIDRLTGGDPKGALSLLESASAPGTDKLENNVGFQLLKVKLFGRTGDFQSAEALLKELVEQNPRELGYRKLLVNFYVGQHRISDAEREMLSLTTAEPSNSAAALDLVRFLLVIKKAPAEARQELNRRVGAGGDVFPFQMALAEMDFAEGNLPAARQSLDNLIASAGTSERVQMARNELARMYLSQRDFDQAERLANDVLRDDARNVPALTIRATIHLERSQTDAAVADLVSALDYEPRSTEVMLLLATAYERSGLIELADKRFADATRVSNFEPRVGLEYAEFLERRGSLARAEDVLAGVLKRQPKNVRIVSALARLRLARQNWTGAQELAKALGKTDSGKADEILGAALIGQGKYDEAITALQKAYQAAPVDARPMNFLVSAFLKANKKDQAMAFLKSALAKNPENANALVLLGSVELASGQADQAMTSFSAAVKKAPKDAVGYQALAGLYLNQKNYDQAIQTLQDGIEQQPDATSLRIALAGALERKGDFEAAISQYESIRDKQPGNLVAANNLASLLLDHRTDPDSLKKAQSIAAMLRKSQIPQFKDTLAWAKYHEGDYGAAVTLSEEAALALPDQASIRYHLGMGYAALSRHDKAAQQLKKALDLAPTGSLAENIRAELRKIGQRSLMPG